MLSRTAADERERAEIVRFAIGAAAVECRAAETVVRDDDIGIGLVVAKHDVVTRREALDQIVLEQQGLGLRARHGGLDAGDLRHHQRDARAGEIAWKYEASASSDSSPCRHRALAVGIEHAVDARQFGHGGQQVFGIEGRSLRLRVHGQVRLGCRL